jgi:hypothetical protein
VRQAKATTSPAAQPESVAPSSVRVRHNIGRCSDVAIGASPYGLSAAAHFLIRAEVNVRVFGNPWRAGRDTCRLGCYSAYGGRPRIYPTRIMRSAWEAKWLRSVSGMQRRCHSSASSIMGAGSGARCFRARAASRGLAPRRRAGAHARRREYEGGRASPASDRVPDRPRALFVSRARGHQSCAHKERLAGTRCRLRVVRARSSLLGRSGRTELRPGNALWLRDLGMDPRADTGGSRPPRATRRLLVVRHSSGYGNRPW